MRNIQKKWLLSVVFKTVLAVIISRFVMLLEGDSTEMLAASNEQMVTVGNSVSYVQLYERGTE